MNNFLKLLLAKALLNGMLFQNRLQVAMGAVLEKAGLVPKQRAAIYSIWQIEHWRGGELLDVETVKNLVVDEGLNDILDTYFKGGTQISTWYVAIFNNDYTPIAGNTYASKGFTESTNYDETNRPTWTGGTVSGKSVDNSASKATFTMSATETVYGAALVGGGSAPQTKNDSAGGGVLYCSAQFSASKAVVDNDVLKVTVTLTSQSA